MADKSFDILALGEILLRFSPERYERIMRSTSYSLQLGGAEVNVLSGLNFFGMRNGLISLIPENDIGYFARKRVRFCGISDDYILYDNSKDARIGTYFYENGSYPRKPRIVYDRKYSSINKLVPDMFPDEMYYDARCFHTTGITLALSEQVRETTIEMIKRFKSTGTIISFDVNFRGNLWTGPEAKETIEKILPYVDIFFCSEDTARLTFLKEGDLKSIMKSFADEWDISLICSTKRIVHSPKLHTFGSMIYNKKTEQFYEEEPYRNIEIVDRIGSGDAYITGVLYGWLTYNDCQKALEFGNATSAIKCTVPGDMQSSALDEVMSIIEEHKSGKSGLEMKR